MIYRGMILENKQTIQSDAYISTYMLYKT